MTATIASFAIYTVAILWAFAAHSAQRSWLGIVAFGGVLLGVELLIGHAS